MAGNRNMTQGKPLSQLFFFAVPLMFGNVFQQMYTVVDTAIVGRGVGLDALAALGGVDWFNWMLLAVCQGLTQGFAVRVAQKFGEGDRKGMKQTVGQSAVLSVVAVLVCVLLAQVFLPGILGLLRVRRELRPMALLYARIYVAGLPAVMFFNYCASMLRAVGDSRTPLTAMIAASLANIVLDVIAVFALNLGIAGAAVATVIAQCLAGGICAVRLARTPELYFGRSNLGADSPLKRNLLRLATPVALKNIVVALGGMMVQAVVNGFDLGFIAGFTATGKLFGLLEIAAVSYGYAITTYVGQNYGAGRQDRIRSGMRAAVVLSVATSLVIAAAMFAFGRQITGLFISTDDPALLARASDTAYGYLSVMSALLPVLYLLYAYMSALQGLGQTVHTMVSGIMELLMRMVFSAFIAWSGWQSGIFFAEIAAWIASTIYMAYHYYRFMKKTGDIPQKGGTVWHLSN